MTSELLQRLIRMERKAQKEFYEKYSVILFRLAYRYAINEQDAGSIVNIAFYRIFKHISNFNYIDEKSMVAWMKKIVINESLIFLRKRFSFEELNDCKSEDIMCDILPNYNLLAEDYYQLIRLLPDELRMVFNLYAIDGYKHKEIARQLNIKESSSRVYLTRARKELQKNLANKI